MSSRKDRFAGLPGPQPDLFEHFGVQPTDRPAPAREALHGPVRSARVCVRCEWWIVDESSCPNCGGAAHADADAPAERDT